jgi:hypothetical protein
MSRARPGLRSEPSRAFLCPALGQFGEAEALTNPYNCKVLNSGGAMIVLRVAACPMQFAVKCTAPSFDLTAVRFSYDSFTRGGVPRPNVLLFAYANVLLFAYANVLMFYCSVFQMFCLLNVLMFCLPNVLMFCLTCF